MIRKKHLIIGCGPAAISALKEIRRVTLDDEVKLVTRGKYFPYSPAGLPYLISGKISETDIWSRDENCFRNISASFHMEKEVSMVLFKEKEVVYSDGSKEQYDTLLAACGSQAEMPLIEGNEVVFPLLFHTFDDYKLLKQRLVGRQRVAVYGGGLVAVEIAVHLVEAGYQVQLIARSRLLRQYFNQEVGDQIENILTREGVQIHKGVTIQRIKRNKKGVEILFSGEYSFDTDLLVICTGVTPQIAFLQETGIGMNQGILVDRRMMTNMTDVYAAGDVAEAPDFFTGSQVVSPIIINAMEQGKIAGSNMAGKEAFYSGSIRGNLLTFFGNMAFSIGLIDHSNKGYKVFKKSVNSGHKYLKLVFDGDFLIGAESLNQDADAGLFRSLISRRVKISPYQGLLTENPAKAARWLLLQERTRPNL